MDCPRCGTADFYESLFSGFDCRNPKCIHGTKAAEEPDHGVCAIEAPEEAGTELERLCTRLKITLSHMGAAQNPPADTSWKPAKSWHVELMRETPGSVDLFMETDFYGGENVTVPTACDVMESVLLDAMTVISAGSYEDWCSELGFDDDSMRARRIYDACLHQSKELRTFLGDHLDEALGAEHS